MYAWMPAVISANFIAVIFGSHAIENVWNATHTHSSYIYNLYVVNTALYFSDPVIGNHDAVRLSQEKIM